MRKTVAAVLGVVAVATVVTTAYAMTVTYSPETGGWSGKGDVQTAFGWNNKLMQQNHNSITFEYEALTEVSFECEWWTGPAHNKSYHSNTFSETYGVSGAVGNQDRPTGQWTGWFLSPVSGDEGDAEASAQCPGNDGGGGDNSGVKTIIEGTIVTTPLGGGLYAVFNGDRRLLQ